MRSTIASSAAGDRPYIVHVKPNIPVDQTKTCLTSIVRSNRAVRIAATFAGRNAGDIHPSVNTGPENRLDPIFNSKKVV